MNKNFLLLAFLFLMNVFAAAQDAKDSTSSSNLFKKKEKIESDKEIKLANIPVRIFNETKSYKINSDENGNYAVTAEPGIYTVAVNYPGFSSYEYKNFSIKNGETKTLDIVLIEKIVTTDEIEVEGIFKQRHQQK